MSKSSEKPDIRRSPKIKTTNEPILDRKYRHSLQPKSLTELPPTALRHTQSHRYDSKGKKPKAVSVSNITSILEADTSEDEEVKIQMKGKAKNASVVYENERKTDSKRTKANKVKKSDNDEDNNKATLSFENSAFEGNMNPKRNSNATIRTISSRAPSIQSLEVVREQYCCCAKRTKCERTLLIVVTILTIVIIVLVTVVVILAQNHDLDELKKNLKL